MLTDEQLIAIGKRGDDYQIAEALLAGASQDIDALLAEVDRLESEVARLREELRVNAHLLADATDQRTEALCDLEAERARSWGLAEKLAEAEAEVYRQWEAHALTNSERLEAERELAEALDVLRDTTQAHRRPLGRFVSIMLRADQVLARHEDGNDLVSLARAQGVTPCVDAEELRDPELGAALLARHDTAAAPEDPGE